MISNSYNISFLKSTTTRRLFPSEIKFLCLSLENENMVSFRMEPMFSVSEVFGLAHASNDHVQIVATYDMLRRRPLSTLSLSISSDGREYCYEYMLTMDERSTIMEKMENFFLQQTGIELKAFCQSFCSGGRDMPLPVTSNSDFEK